MKNFIIDEQKDDQKLLPIDYLNSIQNLIIVNNTVNNTNYNSIGRFPRARRGHFVQAKGPSPTATVLIVVDLSQHDKGQLLPAG